MTRVTYEFRTTYVNNYKSTKACIRSSILSLQLTETVYSRIKLVVSTAKMINLITVQGTSSDVIIFFF